MLHALYHARTARFAVVGLAVTALHLAVFSAVFSTAYRIAGVPPVQSALVATVVSAATSFLLRSRIVFARRPVLDAAGSRTLA